MARTPRVTGHVRTPPGFDHVRYGQGVSERASHYSTQQKVNVVPATAPGDSRGHVYVDATFTDPAEAQDFMDWISRRLGGTGGPFGRVVYHLCSHATGEVPTEPCTAAPGISIVNA